jgi:hypothetical protein
LPPPCSLRLARLSVHQFGAGLPQAYRLLMRHLYDAICGNVYQVHPTAQLQNTRARLYPNPVLLFRVRFCLLTLLSGKVIDSHTGLDCLLRDPGEGIDSGKDQVR